MHDKGDGRLIKQVLWPLPGAIKAYIDDVNADGLPDIMVLFAQAQEGIYLFLNKGSGVFEMKELLHFPQSMAQHILNSWILMAMERKTFCTPAAIMRITRRY